MINVQEYKGRSPWANFANFIGGDTKTSKEAIEAANLNWKVRTQDIYFDPSGQNEWDLIPNQQVVVREDNNKPLGVVSNRYTPIQNEEAFTFMDSLVEKDLMKYHTAGSLRGGKNIFLLAKIGDTEIIPKDHIDKYLLLYNTHDGSSTLKCFFTVVRYACTNAINAALKNNKGMGLSLRHTSGIHDKLEDGKEILGIAEKQFKEYEQFAKVLAGKKMSLTQMQEFAKFLFPDPPEDLKRKSDKHLKKREVLEDLWEFGNGQEILGVRGTMWAAYNAMTEYANFYAPSRGKNKEESRFKSTVLGINNNLIQRGTQELIRLAA
jgi:phage/plasmid-like protein (TIGR03299 family)